MTNDVRYVDSGSGAAESLRILDAIGALPVIDRERHYVRSSDIDRLGVSIHEVQEPDLFRPLSAGPPLTLDSFRSRKPEQIRLVVSPACWLDVRRTVDPLRLQAFVTLYRRTATAFSPLAADLTWSRALLEDTAIWAPHEHLPHVVRLWDRIAGRRFDLQPIEMATTARVYGNKVRLASSIASVMRTYLPDGALVADLMCGSGVVSRILSRSFDVLANDVNPWASAFAQLQLSSVSRSSVETFLEALAEPYAANFAAGSQFLTDELLHEAEFLYGPVDDVAVKRYATFCARPLLDTNPVLSSIVRGEAAGQDAGPKLLTVALFANAYFGVRQSLAIDSIRRSIDVERDVELRQVWLATLLLTATVCGSGPHFAQPPKVSSERSMRELLEHRSRDVLAEFSQLLRLLAERLVTPTLRNFVRCGDWRNALEKFGDERQAPARAVYVDPPYTRLQYARYYHVLNTLIEYRFSPPVGTGRYPAMEMRPSSRFDARERTARAELEELLSAVAERSLVAFLSYSSTGSVSLPDIIGTMEQRFRHVDTYIVPLRHHSQGRRLSGQRGRVDEFVLVGLP